MSDHIAAMFVADVPLDHALPGATRSKNRPSKTCRGRGGRISGITDDREWGPRGAWELLHILRALDPTLPLNTAARQALWQRICTVPFTPSGWRKLNEHFSLEDWQRQVADHCRGKNKLAHERLLSDMRRMARNPAVRRGFELERDRLEARGRAACPLRIKGIATLLGFSSPQPNCP